MYAIAGRKEVRVRSRVVVSLQGGLGNQLFNLATGLALASANGRSLELDLSWFRGRQRPDFLSNYRRHPDVLSFPRVASTLGQRGRALGPVGYRKETLTAAVMRRLALNVDPLDELPGLGRRTWVRGQMFKPNWFSAHREELQGLLALQPEEAGLDPSLLEKIRRRGQRLVAVHVRRGDNVVEGNLNPVLQPEFFRSAMEACGFNSSTVLVFSDSPEWCRNQKAFSEWCVVDEVRPHVALWLMSQAEDFVLSPSTFGWWAAWLSAFPDKRVVVPAPFQPASEDQWKDLVLPGWHQHPGRFAQGTDV